jgi:hypothetical protein
MPTAPDDWLARLQGKVTPSQFRDPMRNLMALVDEAARENDTAALTRMCSDLCHADTQAAVWAEPGALETLSHVIEKAPAGEGGTLPDFTLTGTATSFTTPADKAFGQAYGYQSPADYFTKTPYWTAFMNGSGGVGLKVEWQGVLLHHTS